MSMSTVSLYFVCTAGPAAYGGADSLSAIVTYLAGQMTHVNPTDECTLGGTGFTPCTAPTDLLGA